MYIVSPGTRRCKGMISTIVIYHSLCAHVGDPFALTLLIWLACFGLGSFDDFLFGKKVRGSMWLPLINLCRCGPVDGDAER